MTTTDFAVNRTRATSRKWITWSVLVIVYAITFFHKLAIGSIRSELIEAFGVSSTTFANLSSAFMYTFMLMQIPAGVLTDFFGARKTAVLAAVSVGIGTIIFGSSPNISWAFIGRICIGFGASMAFLPILKIQSQWFEEHQYATVTGLTSFVGFGGSLLAQTPLTLLLTRFNWRSIFISLGAATILISVLSFILVKEKKHENGSENNDDLNIKQAISGVLKNPYTWPAFLIFMGLFGGYIAFCGTWGKTYLEEVHSLNSLAASKIILAGTASATVGTLLVGTISDLIGKRKIMIILLSMLSLCSWSLLFIINPSDIPQWLLVLSITGIGFAVSTPVLLFTNMKEINNKKYIGIASSIIMAGGYLGGALVPILMGKFIDVNMGFLSTDVYQKALIFGLIASVIAALFSFFIKEGLVTKKGEKKYE